MAILTFFIKFAVHSCFNQTASSFHIVVSSHQISHNNFFTADFQKSTAQPNIPGCKPPAGPYRRAPEPPRARLVARMEPKQALESRK
jgi:hypothetical protein